MKPGDLMKIHGDWRMYTSDPRPAMKVYDGVNPKNDTFPSQTKSIFDPTMTALVIYAPDFFTWKLDHHFAFVLIDGQLGWISVEALVRS